MGGARGDCLAKCGGAARQGDGGGRAVLRCPAGRAVPAAQGGRRHSRLSRRLIPPARKVPAMPSDAGPSVSDLHFLTIAEASRLIERRQLSPVALTEAFLE